MENIFLTLKFINKSPHENIRYAHEGDSGFDIRAWITEEESEDKKITLKPLERRLFHTGLYVQLPLNTELHVRPRSGNALKLGLGVLNSPATIDNFYEGEVGVILVNLSNDEIVIHDGDRIAQGVVCPVFNSLMIRLEETDNVKRNSSRGEGGFGHTGLK